MTVQGTVVDSAITDEEIQEVKHLIIQVGLGGTGSYFTPKLVNYLSTTKADVVLVDGDALEEKNLLRQRFLKTELGMPKAEAVAKRFANTTHTSVTYLNKFINSVKDIIDITDNYYKDKEEKGNRKDIYIISCVDNNMARLRLIVAMHILQERYDRTIHFIDSGNAEYHGQTFSIRLYRGTKTMLNNIGSKVYANLVVTPEIGETPKEYTIDNLAIFDKIRVGSSKRNKYGTIFTGMGENWENFLTKADYETSCDDEVVANPQNISTNMMAASLLFQRFHAHFTNDTISETGVFQFDTKSNKYNPSTSQFTEGIENNTIEFYSRLVKYLKTPTGYNEVFSDIVLSDNGEILNFGYLPYVKQQ